MTSLNSPSKSGRAKTRDRDVRQAVLTQVLGEHRRDPNARVVEELGLEHGAYRVDIAVVNGFLHGYELKSDMDNLARLPKQAESYSRCLDRVTLVVSESHVDEATNLVPHWWGIKVATVNKSGNVRIETHRAVQNNPDLSLVHMAKLLWKSEVIALLQEAGATAAEQKGNRAMLYQRLVDKLPTNEFRRAVRETVKIRENWRDRAPL